MSYNCTACLARSQRLSPDAAGVAVLAILLVRELNPAALALALCPEHRELLDHAKRIWMSTK
jgi:hypothetical protein